MNARALVFGCSYLLQSSAVVSLKKESFIQIGFRLAGSTKWPKLL